MGTEEKQPEQHEVEVPMLKTGKVNFLNKEGFDNPAPVALATFLSWLRYVCTGLITMVSGSDLFSGAHAKIICFCLGVIILLSGGVQKGTGVAPIKKD